MADGKIDIGVELTDDGVQSQAQRVGAEAGKGIESGIKDGTEKSGGLLEGLKGKFSAAFAAMGGIAAGFSMANVAAEIVNTGKQFEASMSNVAALSGVAGDELDSLEAKARELGASTTFSASEAADALGYMALAGWDSAQMLEGVDGVLTLAQAGQMDLAASSDLVTDYLSAFGMEASETGRMVDVLAYAQANANTTVDGLGMAFKNVAANAHAAGMDVETTTAAISMLANQGLKGSEAGTALAAVMRDMTAKMKDGAIGIGETSVAVQDSEGNYRDFADILADVEAATNGMGEAERASALMATFTADSIKGLNLMLNAGAGELASFRDELYNSSGAAQGLADTMTDNLEGDLKAMNSAWEEFQLKVYEGAQEPLRDLTQFATSTVIPGMQYLAENIDKVGPVLATIGVALVAYRKNWDMVTAAQNLAAKATTLSQGQMLSFKREVVAGETVMYRLDKATGQYVRTNATLATSVATSTVGIKAQAVAQKASAAASELAAKAAGVAGRALRTIAPVAAISAILSIAESFRKAAEDADTLERATGGLGDALESVSGSESGIDSVADGYERSASEIIESSRDAIQSQADLADSIKGTFSDIGANNALVDGYVGTIENLAGKSNLTAEEQGRLASAVSGLNGVCGTTYEVIDAVNGQLSASTAEITANAEAWKKNAEAQAMQEAYQDAVKNRIKQEEELAAATKAADEAERDFELTLGDVRLVEGFATAQANELADQRDAQAEAVEAAREAEEGLSERLGESTAAAQQSAEAAQANAEATAGSADAAAGMSEASQQASDEMAELVDSVNKAAEEHSGFAEAMADAGYTAEEMAQALKATGGTADELASSIESVQGKTADAFDEIGQAAEISLDQMQANLEKNAETTRGWSENVSALYARAGSSVETDFVAYLAELGPEYSSVLDQLAEATPEKLSQLATAWSESMDAGREGAVTAAQMNSDAVAAAVEQGRDQVAQASAGMGDALPEGIESGSAQAASAMQSSVDAAANGAVAALEGKRTAMGSAASSVMTGAGEAARASGVPGFRAAANESANAMPAAMQAAQPAVAAAGSSLGKAGASGMASSLTLYAAEGANASSSYSQGIQSGGPQASAAASSVSSGAASSMGAGSGEAYTTGVNLVQGMINGIGSMGGALSSAARSIARSALNAMKSELDIHSPSKRAEKEVGKNMALGVAQGIEKNKKYAKKKASELSAAVVSAAKTKLSEQKRIRDVSLAQEAKYWKEIVKHTKKGTKARKDALLEYKAVNKQIADQRKKDQQTLKKAMADYKEAARKIAKDLAEDIAKVESDLAESIADVQSDLAKDIADAWEGYYDAVESRADSILSGFSIFDRFRVTSQRDAAVLIDNMETQAEAAEEYRRQMDELRDRIGEGDLYNEIAEQGVDALGQIRTLNSMSADEIARYMELYARRNEAARKEAEDENEKLLADTIATVQQLTNEANSEIERLKKEAGEEVAELTKQAAEDAKAAAQDLAETASGLSTKMAAAVAKMANSIKKSSKTAVAEIEKQIKALEKLAKKYNQTTGAKKKSTSKKKKSASNSKTRASEAASESGARVVYGAGGEAVGIARSMGGRYMGQVERSIARGAAVAAVAAVGGSTTRSVTNNQSITFNAPVPTPDEVARTMRMQQRYGLAGEY